MTTSRTVGHEAEGLLDVRSLTVRYGPITAVREVSIGVDRGEIVALLGPNGAGKSTILKALVGLVPIATGDVLLEGKSIRGAATESIVKRGMTLCPEGRRIFQNLSVDDNLKIGAHSRQDPTEVARDRDRMFALFPILSERLAQLAGSLSGGEQQQLAIARALMSAPSILLLDEPSLGLAPRIVDAVFEAIESLRDQGITILLVEQNAELALEIADRAYVLSTGRIELAGPANELLQSSGVERSYLGLSVVT